MKKMCILSGNCHLAEAGQLTDLIGFNGEEIYTGDLVFVYQKQDYNADLTFDEEGASKLFIESLTNKTYSEKLHVVVKDSFVTYTDKSIVLEAKDRGWIFGWKSADMNDYHIFKIKHYHEVENGFSHANFRYEVKDLEIKES